VDGFSVGTTGGRFYVVRYRGRYMVRDNVRQYLPWLGAPRGDVLAAAVCRRLNALGELGLQALMLDGDHAIDALALKYLNEEHHDLWAYGKLP
jgi:hypothetical protein